MPEWTLARRLGPLLRKLRFEGECWIFTGDLHQGYGKYAGYPAHRVAYELLVGPIPDGLELDHLCRNTACVFPDHMEPVTREVNRKRAVDLRTQCKHGHEYTPENTHVRRRDGFAVRVCRRCAVETNRKYRARQREGGRP